MTKVNFAPTVDVIPCPLPGHRIEDHSEKISDYENMGPIPINGRLDILPQETSMFLEADKVELEIGKNGGLIISRSTADRLYELGRLGNNNAEGNKVGEKKGLRKYAGMILAFSASFFFSLTVVMVKILKDYHPLSISVWRYLGILVPSIPIVLYFQFLPQRKKGLDINGVYRPGEAISIFQTVWPFRERDKLVNFAGLMARGLLGCTSVLLRFYSLKYLTVADSSVISYSGPVFVAILAHFCIGEKCGFVSIVLALVTSLGVFVIVRPPILTGALEFDTDTLIGSSLAFLSMLCNSSVIILMRKIRQVHWALMLLTFGSWGVAESLVVALSFGVLQFPVGLYDSVLTLVVLPVLVFCGQISIILAVKFENAGPVSLIRTCDVIFSFIWQFLFLSVLPDIYSLIGAIIVVSGVVLTALRKWLSNLPEDNATRNKFRMLLM